MPENTPETNEPLPDGWLTADEMDRELTRRGYTKVQHKTPQEALDALNRWGREQIGDRWEDMSYAGEDEQ